MVGGIETVSTRAQTNSPTTTPCPPLAVAVTPDLQRAGTGHPLFRTVNIDKRHHRGIWTMLLWSNRLLHLRAALRLKYFYRCEDTQKLTLTSSSGVFERAGLGGVQHLMWATRSVCTVPVPLDRVSA